MLADIADFYPLNRAHFKLKKKEKGTFWSHQMQEKLWPMYILSFVSFSFGVIELNVPIAERSPWIKFKVTVQF